MKILSVHASDNRIQIVECVPDRTARDPLSFVQVAEREVTLTPREYDGHAVMAAYDRETDTLYIKVSP